ncbi:MAG: hypothetical protein PVI40_03365 [Chlamydiota bacterium]|jgi:hypothetical protein
MTTPVSQTTPLVKPRTAPIIATLRSSTCVFQVRCESTGKWISSAHNTFGWAPGEEQDAWREALKKTAYRFYKWKEDEKGNLWITPPVGYWLADGRLVSSACKEGERVEAYYGSKAEIVDRRIIRFITDGPFTFLPRKEK